LEEIRLALILISVYSGKWDILPESATELDRLVSLVKENPELKVELSSHTDERGTNQYNLKLSRLRAQTAVDYIISKGIDKSRVAGIGYGKSQLLNKCTESCTPAQHRENRRTELYIPGFLRGEQVKQEVGDYSNGKPDHTQGYSSSKEHGNIVAGDFNVSDGVKFYLILGSFKTKVRALILVNQLKAEGYEAIILGDPNIVRVGIGYKFLSQTKKALEELKPKYKDGWIFQVN